MPSDIGCIVVAGIQSRVDSATNDDTKTTTCHLRQRIHLLSQKPLHRTKSTRAPPRRRGTGAIWVHEIWRNYRNQDSRPRSCLVLDLCAWRSSEPVPDTLIFTEQPIYLIVDSFGDATSAVDLARRSRCVHDFGFLDHDIYFILAICWRYHVRVVQPLLTSNWADSFLDDMLTMKCFLHFLNAVLLKLDRFRISGNVSKCWEHFSLSCLLFAVLMPCVLMRFNNSAACLIVNEVSYHFVFLSRSGLALFGSHR